MFSENKPKKSRVHCKIIVNFKNEFNNNENFSIMAFDTIDKTLLELLQEDSKQTNKELSNKLILSVTAVYERY